MREADVELEALGWFRSQTYKLRHGPEIDDAGERAELTRPVLEGRLMAALHRINPALTQADCEQVLRTLSRPPHLTLVENNRWFHSLLTDGVEVEYQDTASGEMRAVGRGWSILKIPITTTCWLSDSSS